eukprot:CAMPEP_0173393410 /NCGR_PEP_ID=MMETSP1356-20130122/22094_1 /TAXON_ID=77927 ORGANISM="Hemiselmis virescens, Strain PCC157" /NCGR_SAMPLE_ID=MMETSP1356 /ASSEMBLY_ACC=CAM_ASM_000847 /LENGTH=116 /DNA_ID=CAMNT_0014351421 /DNA_START=11 /DNA_END=358 /DNA_ORIENTATION=+
MVKGQAAFLALAGLTLLAGGMWIKPARRISMLDGVSQGSMVIAKARQQQLSGSDDLALGNKPIGPGQSMRDFPNTWSNVESGGVIGPTWVLGTYDSTRAPAVSRRPPSARTQKLQL